MKQKICLLALLFLFFQARAAQQPLPGPLTIGDRLPRISLSNVIHAPSGNLSTGGGKPIVIDFWATNCGSCVSAAARYEQLSIKYSSSVQFLLVSYEKRAIVEAFLAKNSIGKTLTLPIVTDDTLLSRLFPHRILSHEVWIDKKGQVCGITGPDYVDGAHLDSLAEGLTMNMPVKRDLSAYDYTRPLNADNSATYYSLLQPYKPGIAPRFGVQRDSLHHRVRLWVVNFPILQMYLLATDKLLYFPKTMLRIHVADMSRIHRPANTYSEPWARKNAWCYEATFPEDVTAAAIKTTFINDLNRFFSLDAGMRKVDTLCLTLERISPGDSIPLSKGGIPLNRLHTADTIKILRNDGLDDIIWELNDIKSGLPAYDQTGFTGTVDMELHLRSFADLDALNEALLPYHLIVRKKMAPLNLFIMTDAINH